MNKRAVSALSLATILALAGGASALPVMPFVPDIQLRAFDRPGQSDDARLILAQGRGRSGGGGAQRQAGSRGQRASGGGFNSNNFHSDLSNTRSLNGGASRNTTVNRNANVNTSRNVNVSGGCCYGDYNSGPSWGGVVAGVAVGAAVGAAVNSAASSPTYAAPPPTYPPDYVSPPPY